MSIFASNIRKILFKFPPETAHNIAIKSLKYNLVPAQKTFESEILHNNIFGLSFKNPVGLAAGFDKNAEGLNCLSNQAFGFLEVGTVTPKPQIGNPKPRIFRLEQDKAIINCLGFNNKGINYYKNNISKFNKSENIIVGANLGKNKDTKSATEDYLLLLKEIYGLTDYITINISSPNTPGLRDIQNQKDLDSFLKIILAKRNDLAIQHNKKIPLLLKIAPDNSDKQIKQMAEVVSDNAPDGLIISNTTIGGREALKSSNKRDIGGLSGKPLFDISTKNLSAFYKATKGEVPIIGVGGISSTQGAYEKIKKGASLIQIYSALIYQGFELVNDIKKGLVDLSQKDGLKNIKEAIGVES